MKSNDVLDTFESMIKKFKENNTRYSDNWKVVGKVMAALFPNGITLKTENDFARYHFFDWIVGKLTRYTNLNLNDEDSILDEAVYSVMLATLTRIMNDENKG